jgi:UDP-N-acetylmuramoyl-L-alanyl-D-glutamate--2,6-diaminopimelate ligase
MKLQELLRGVDVIRILGADDVDLANVTSDSRQAGAGSLFIAIPGFARNGAEFIESAVSKGARAVVTEQEDVRIDATLVQVRDARAAQATIAANYFGNPAKNLSIVGVTGTSGKTTTTKMLESIFDATGEPVGLIGTIEYRAGETKELADRTTPDAIVLQRWFARMVEEKVRYAVMEVSSHALALKRTHGVEFAAAVFTNLSRDHLDFHKDFEDYYQAKKILFSQIDRSKKRAIVNADDEYGARLARELGENVITFGRNESADIHPAPGFRVDVRGLNGRLVTPWGEVEIASPLIGYPNLSNWMAAIGAALSVGIDAATVSRGVAALRSVRGRFERVGDEQTRETILVDYAHKPDALEKLLHTARELAPDRKVVVIFGCGGDRDQGKRPIMGEIAGRLADRTILTSDNPRSEKPEAILQQIEAGMKKVNGAAYEVIADRRAAIARGVELAREGAVVIVAGKGHENYQVIGDQIIHFDDREEVESALRKSSENS